MFLFAYRNCFPECLETRFVENKIILCDKHISLGSVKEAGALGCIAPNAIENSSSTITPLPAITLSVNSIGIIKAYKTYAK